MSLRDVACNSIHKTPIQFITGKKKHIVIVLALNSELFFPYSNGFKLFIFFFSMRSGKRVLVTINNIIFF